MSRQHRAIWRVLALLTLAPLLSVPANAQQVFGSIFGTVTDSTGSVVVGAKVTVTDVNKGTKFTVLTDQVGELQQGSVDSRPLHGRD